MWERKLKIFSTTFPKTKSNGGFNKSWILLEMVVISRVYNKKGSVQQQIKIISTKTYIYVYMVSQKFVKEFLKKT